MCIYVTIIDTSHVSYCDIKTHVACQLMPHKDTTYKVFFKLLYKGTYHRLVNGAQSYMSVVVT